MTIHRLAILRPLVSFQREWPQLWVLRWKKPPLFHQSNDKSSDLSPAPQYGHRIIILQQSFSKWAQTEFKECPTAPLNNSQMELLPPFSLFHSFPSSAIVVWHLEAFFWFLKFHYFPWLHQEKKNACYHTYSNLFILFLMITLFTPYYREKSICNNVILTEINF